MLGIAFYLWVFGISLWWLAGGLIVLAGLFVLVHIADRDSPPEPHRGYRITYDENGEPIDIEEVVIADATEEDMVISCEKDDYDEE